MNKWSRTIRFLIISKPTTVISGINFCSDDEDMYAVGDYPNSPERLALRLLKYRWQKCIDTGLSTVSFTGSFRIFCSRYIDLVCQYNFPLDQMLFDVFNTND
jgi:hypothetical protein